MHRRTLRHGLVVVLFLAAAGAGAFAWNAGRQLSALGSVEHTTSARFDAIVQSIARFDAVQQQFEPGRAADGDTSRQPESDWFARVKRVLSQIESESKSLHSSAAAASAARTFDDVTGRVVSAVARAEENLRDGRDLMAADLLQDEARPGAEAMRAAAVEWRAAEGNAVDTAKATLLQQLWAVLGGTLALWVIGVLLLAPPQTVAAAASTMPIVAASAGDAPTTPAAEPDPLRAAAPIGLPPTMSLVPAAELCADITRADSAEALAALVDRAAGVLGASGIVVWLAAGDEAELVPVLAHGYGPHLRAILGTLPLAAENITTRAWHTGQLQLVEADTRSRGALAAPMFQGMRRTGVLSVELTHDTRAGELARALTSILAAQFATAVSPQPIEPVAATTPSLEATGSD
jgi:hypothetical protein